MTMTDERFSFLGIGTEQGQKNLGLIKSPNVALELMPLGWPKMTFKILQQQSETKKVHRSSDLQLLDWTIYKKAYAAIIKNFNIGLTQINWGGDHSIGLATVSSFLSHFPNGYIIWIDAHADLNTPESSPTGNFHGMPLSYLMGISQSPLSRNCPFWGVLDPKKIIYIGLRDLDPYEKYLIRLFGIKTYFCDELHSCNFINILHEIKTLISNYPIHISFDIDSIDPVLAASTGVPSPQGLQLFQLQLIASALSLNQNIKSIDIVEINPEIGSREEVLKTYAIAFDFLDSLFNFNRRYKNDANYKPNKNYLPITNKWDLLLFP